MKQLQLLIVMILLTSSVCSAKTMSVAFSGAEVRSNPAVASSKTLFSISKYAPVTVIEEGKEYFKVKDYRGRQGWLHRSLLSDQAGIVITGDPANVRKGPGTNHPVVFQLKRGDGGKILSRENNWVQIKSESGRTGWVAEFLTRSL